MAKRVDNNWVGRGCLPSFLSEPWLVGVGAGGEAVRPALSPSPYPDPLPLPPPVAGAGAGH